MTQPLFQPPVMPCEGCREERERAESYRERMKAADRRNAELLGQVARLKDDLDYLKAAQ